MLWVELVMLEVMVTKKKHKYVEYGWEQTDLTPMNRLFNFPLAMHTRYHYGSS